MENLTSCDTCRAVLFVDDFFAHMEWHEDIRDFIRAMANGEA